MPSKPTRKTRSFNRPSRLLNAVFACVALIASSAFAQDLTDQRAETQREFEQLQLEMQLSDDRKAELAQEIQGLEKDRTTLNRQMIEASTKSRTLEKRIARTEERLSQLRDQQHDARDSLKGRTALLSEILGALQRMGRKPPPALLVTPQDALSSVRSAILLGAVVPEVRAETEILVTELGELVRISNDIENQRTALSTDLSNLAQEEERLTLLLAEKRKLSNNARTDLANESARAATLAARATSLSTLIDDLEREITSAREAVEAARIADEERRKLEQERIASAREDQAVPDFRDTGRIAPAISFVDAKGLLPLPVAGAQMIGFGEIDGSGDKANGLSIATRPKSRVVSPTDGWVVYAGPFRSYGQLLILNAGNGYHVVVAGMEMIDVQPGQFVLVGEPVGSMGTKRIASAGAVEVASTRPILYVEFRKDGESIDPSPWWEEENVKRAVNDS